MRWILLILATLISFTAFGKDESQTTTRYRYNSVITIDPTVQIMAEDGSWTNTAKTLGYLSLVTNDIQTQLNAQRLGGSATNAQPPSGVLTNLSNGTGGFTNSGVVSLTNSANLFGGTGNFGTLTSATMQVTGSMTASNVTGNGFGLTNIQTGNISNFLGAVTNVASTYGGITLAQATNVAGSLTNGFIVLLNATNVANASALAATNAFATGELVTATNNSVKSVVGTNLLNGGSSAGQILTATTGGVTWSNAAAGGTFTGGTITNNLVVTNTVGGASGVTIGTNGNITTTGGITVPQYQVISLYNDQWSSGGFSTLGVISAAYGNGYFGYAVALYSKSLTMNDSQGNNLKTFCTNNPATGWLWNSNAILYWVTSNSTIKIAGP